MGDSGSRAPTIAGARSVRTLKDAITIKFTGTADASYQTSFVIDDTALTTQ